MPGHGSIDERLARVPLFQGLSKKQLGRVASLMTRLEFPAGTVLVREGGTGREFFIVLEGEVEVARDGTTVASLGPGDYVGEIALLDDRPRTATVTATTHVVAEVLDPREFSSLLDKSPDISTRLVATMAKRLAELDRDTP